MTLWQAALTRAYSISCDIEPMISCWERVWSVLTEAGFWAPNYDIISSELHLDEYWLAEAQRTIDFAIEKGANL